MQSQESANFSTADLPDVGLLPKTSLLLDVRRRRFMLHLYWNSRDFDWLCAARSF